MYKTPARSIFLAILAVAMPAVGRAQATMWEVGDLPGGGTYSEIRDATFVGGTIYAVGAGSTFGTSSGNVAILWRSDTGMTALPNLATTTSTRFNTAGAISSDGAVIAGRAFNTTGGNSRVAVTWNTSNLSSATALTQPSGYGALSYAVAMNSTGSVVYGLSTATDGSGYQMSVRWSGGTGVTVGPTGNEASSPALHGVSADGMYMIGTTGTAASKLAGPGAQAFVYNHNDGGFEMLPGLTGTTWSMGMGINANHTRALLGGDSTANPNGELWFYNGASPVTPLGSPMSGWTLNNGAGMTDDGSVVFGVFSPTAADPNTTFIHNSSGWFNLQTVATGAGANLTGWSNLSAEGINSDGTLIYGIGIHNTATEGFVLNFSNGYLAAVPEPSSYAAIFGAGGLVLALWRRRASAKSLQSL